MVLESRFQHKPSPGEESRARKLGFWCIVYAEDER
jgi:hypothetical protein